LLWVELVALARCKVEAVVELAVFLLAVVCL
jgi:hypothetical protein